MTQLLLTVMLVAAFVAACLERRKGEGLVFAAADEDIKIAPDSMSELFAPVDTAQDAADAFVQQRSNGNIGKARRLGKKLARALPKSIAQYQQLPQTPQVLRQVQLLYTYLVFTTIQEQSPDSILAQTALRVYQQTVQAASEEAYDAVVDSAGFTLYRLAQRRGEDPGSVFAELCGHPGDEQLAEVGQALYKRYQEHCITLCERAGYQS